MLANTLMSNIKGNRDLYLRLHEATIDSSEASWFEMLSLFPASLFSALCISVFIGRKRTNMSNQDHPPDPKLYQLFVQLQDIHNLPVKSPSLHPAFPGWRPNCFESANECLRRTWQLVRFTGGRSKTCEIMYFQGVQKGRMQAIEYHRRKKRERLNLNRLAWDGNQANWKAAKQRSYLPKR